MNKIFLFLLLISLLACSSPQNEEQANYFFSLQTYFEKEAQRLNTSKPVIIKEVSYNEGKEIKQLAISGWEDELGLFIESDINKIAWKNSYQIDSTLNKLVYTAKESDLKTRSIEIIFKHDKPISFKIINKVNNRLYQSSEMLIYMPDSLYQINKEQKVRFLENNRYNVKGVFLK